MAKHHVEHHHSKGSAAEVHHHHHKKGGAVKRAKGGRTAPGNVASGDPVVIKEAEGKEDYSRRKGGRIKRRDGGMVQMTGGAVRPRLDRPGRKTGGRVGSDRSPLTSAHHTSSSESLPKEDGGD